MHWLRLGRFGESAEDSDSAASTQLSQRFPAIDLQNMLLRCHLELTSGRKTNPKDLSTANHNAPSDASPDEAHSLVYRPQEWLLTDMHQLVQWDFESIVCPCDSRLGRLRHAYKLRQMPAALPVFATHTDNSFTSRIRILNRCHDPRLLILTDTTRSTKRLAVEQLSPLGVAVMTLRPLPLVRLRRLAL
jgi:hypothetical protein